ncbi:MAG: hypothetical protein KKD66_26915 [Proteobacteria bacterium]|nr:hypothetical protein [Pseudomonadota bacterium]
MTEKVAGKLYEITGQLFEIGHQLRQPNGYPFDAEMLKKHLQAAIEGKFYSNWMVWKTIQLGTGLKTADEFRRVLKSGEFRISDWANDIMGKFGFTVSSFAELDLAIVTVAELGFPKGATRKEIYKRARSFGLELCPSEVGPQLRLQYRDQPNGEWLFIAMEPIKDSGGVPYVFRVGRGGGGLWLRASDDYPGRVWGPGRRWVFALRK